MKKPSILLLTISLATAMSASASVTYSGSDLSSLAYAGGPGDAQYVAGTPDVAQLYTSDLSVNGDSPAVFIQLPAGITLGSFSASYATSAGTTVDPYWVIYLTEDTGFNSPIVSTSSGPISGSSLIHVGNLINGSTTLSTFDAAIDPVSGLPYGQDLIAWAGLEIGDGGSGAGTANIESITYSSTAPIPEPTTIISGALLLLPFGAGAVRFIRKTRTV